MKKLIIFILCSLFFALTSCKPKQKITETVNSSVTESTYIHDKLTPVALPVDSSHIKALFECDSTNKVILKQLFEVKSKNINTTFSYKDGLLDYSIRTGGDTVYIPGRDFYWIVHNETRKTVTITKTVKVEKQLTISQKMQITAGNIFVFILMSIILYFIIRFFRKYLMKNFGI
jgi:hypothetical protein